ncbi:MAG: type IA DNA topoisomerase [Lachnospiraceae bacterium]|nr:type IA DNA topoisomerase [Lachnospiraceae bacterium]
MGKSLYIAEKPSVAREFADALDIKGKKYDGYMESDDAVVTWCVGHLVTMSYPEVYDESLKKWRLDALPFIPETFRYEVIDNVKKQFNVVKGLLTRDDVDTIYVCTDSGREGEYIYRLVDMMAGVGPGKNKKRVWIDSQTRDEILRGIREAKDLAAYDDLADAAYLRAKEDYLMGINFSRLMTLKYGSGIASGTGMKYAVVSVGRVMTCVLGMVVRREREIRSFVKTPFFRVMGRFMDGDLTGEWRAVEGSRYYGSPLLYKENGFKERKDAEKLVAELSEGEKPWQCTVDKVEKKTEKKNPPLLYNLAELQNDCSRILKISPDQTLKIAQELYEKKLTTYPRTDARVLSTPVAKEIAKNINGLENLDDTGEFAKEILEKELYKGIEKSRYTDDKKITDHYAIIPTGQGLNALKSLGPDALKAYDMIVRRFLSIFYPPAVYKRISVVIDRLGEKFFCSEKILTDPGYLKVLGKALAEEEKTDGDGENGEKAPDDAERDRSRLQRLSKLKKGDIINADLFEVKEGETSPPRRYNSGTMILAMENAGQLIEDETLREQIKSTGIGTSATRAEILKKLFTIKYLNLNKKTQIITPTLLGEDIYDAVYYSIKSLLDPEFTASWEKGLNMVSGGEITSNEYMDKLSAYIRSKTGAVKSLNNAGQLTALYRENSKWYKKK